MEHEQEKKRMGKPFPYMRPGHKADNSPVPNFHGMPSLYIGYTESVFSRRYFVQVDSEHKGKAIKLWSFMPPHMLSFHLNWVGFFLTFFSAYAAAPLISYIRQDINLTQYQANIAGVVTTSGTVVMRIAIGSICDKVGPRYTFAALLLCVASFVFGICLVENHISYIIVRLLIGFGLATFVCCQFWTSIMFAPTVVGMANAISGGWGNAGGGITQIVMPNLAERIQKNGTSQFMSWRWAFFLPGCMHIGSALAILAFGQDTPDGNWAELERTGKKQKQKFWREMFNGLTNYRVWGLALCYAYSFGVELALDNVLPTYLGNNFNFSVTKAGNLAAIFGTLNFIARPMGGVFSDLMGRKWGMRGRIWCLFLYQASAGLWVALLGHSSGSYPATIAFIVLAAFAIEGTCGCIYGVVPFVSRRSTGLCCGLVSAGGASGGVINQAIFFLNTATVGSYYVTPPAAMKWMGGVMCIVAMIGVAPVYFPMWGGLILGPKKGATEEEYYYAEYTAAEREQGLHYQVSAFAANSRSMRGMKRLAADAKAGPAKTSPAGSSGSDDPKLAVADDSAHNKGGTNVTRV
eukprot:jgi/Astpho2/3456/Aster-07053